MNHRLVTTIEKDIIYSALLDEKDQLVEIHPEQSHNHSSVGDIYIGRISNVVDGIHATFVNIGQDKDVFLQIEEGQHFIYTNKKASHEMPKVGDELLIQITKESYMSKAPTATSMINVTGRYCVLTYKKNYVGVSTKIKGSSERSRLKRIFTEVLCEDFGFIIRTNAEEVAEEDLIKERDQLIAAFYKLIENAKYRRCFQCIYKEPHNYIRLIRDLYKNNVESYIFDNEELYQNALDYFSDCIYGDLPTRFKLHLDSKHNLYALLGLGAKIEKALYEKVWLNSGANLFIQLTEALTVIDVNTSKSVSKKNFEDTIYAINQEAAKEIARQIRLRNLSGIIIIDFIDMHIEEHKQKLLSSLSAYFLEDRIKTTLVDMTPLGLVEITRKKSDKNIYEKFKLIQDKRS